MVVVWRSLVLQALMFVTAGTLGYDSSSSVCRSMKPAIPGTVNPMRPRSAE